MRPTLLVEGDRQCRSTWRADVFRRLEYGSACDVAGRRVERPAGLRLVINGQLGAIIFLGVIGHGASEDHGLGLRGIAERSSLDANIAQDEVAVAGAAGAFFRQAL